MSNGVELWQEYFWSDGGMKGQRSMTLGLKILKTSRNVLICIQVMFDYHVDECLSLMMF